MHKGREEVASIAQHRIQMTRCDPVRHCCLHQSIAHHHRLRSALYCGRTHYHGRLFLCDHRHHVEVDKADPRRLCLPGVVAPIDPPAV